MTGGGGEDCISPKVRFEISGAENEPDNVLSVSSKKRYFVLAQNNCVKSIEIKESDLTVRFEHRPLSENEKNQLNIKRGIKQSHVNKLTVKSIRSKLDSNWNKLLDSLVSTNPHRTLLEKHIERYTSKNEFDYFIHKNLAEFLGRELDQFLKSAVLDIGALQRRNQHQLNRAIGELVAVQSVGKKIIEFLGQIEDYQKHLWLKKKFVLDSQICVSLDLIPELFYPEIAQNRFQVAEWIELFALNEITPNLANGMRGFSDPLEVEFLKQNQFLIIDTKHFSRKFKDKLLGALSEIYSLDEHTNGLLIHSENFQALNLLQSTFRGLVQCIYIDPPYNTNSSPILYKNNYKDSCWLSLMKDRLSLSKSFLSMNGVVCCAIDDEEVSVLRLLMEQIFENELGTAVVRSNAAGRKSKGRLSPSHEYALFYGKANAVPGTIPRPIAKQKRSFPYTDEIGRFTWTNLIRSGSNNRREDRPKMYFPIYISDSEEFRIPNMEWDSTASSWNILEHEFEDEEAIWPIRSNDDQEVEGCWHKGEATLRNDSKNSPSEYRIRRRKANGDDRITLQFKSRMDEKAPPITWWDQTKYQSALHGPKSIIDYFGNKVFDYPKSIGLVEDCLLASNCHDESIVLDFFAGSGTTGEAVINLNRDDGGQRKFILIEMGHHFDEVTLPRVKKICYSKSWQSGKPTKLEKSTAQLFKYIRLESYEDTLDSIEFEPLSTNQQQLLKSSSDFAENYMLRYAFTSETSSSPCLMGKDFRNPFSYTISVVRDGVRQELSVDLIETFNFLLGMRVEKFRKFGKIYAISGKNRSESLILILWRDQDLVNNSALEEWFQSSKDQYSKFNLIYVNGDHTLNSLKQPSDRWSVNQIEPKFRELMFDDIH